MFARTFASSAGLRVVGMGLSFLVGVQLARELGPHGYGTYGIAMSVIALLMVPTEFGLPQLVTREVAAATVNGDEGLLRRIISWTNRMIAWNALGVAIMAALVLMLAGVRIDTDLKSTLFWGVALLPIVAVGNVLSAALRGVHRIIAGQLADLLVRPGAMAVLLLFATVLWGRKELSPNHAMASNVLAASLGATFAFWKLSPFLRRSAAATNPGALSEGWLKKALPMAMSEGMRILAGHVAILILGVMASASEVGVYRVAAGLWTVATLPSTLLYVVCAPMLATLHQEGKSLAIQRLNAWMALFLTVAATAFIFPFAVSGEAIIGVVFGEAYRGSNPILLILLFGELVSAMLGHPPTVLNMMGHDREVAKYSIYALLGNICFCLILTPLYGAIGVAIGVATGQVLWRLLGSLHAKKHLGLNTSIVAWLHRQ